MHNKEIAISTYEKLGTNTRLDLSFTRNVTKPKTLKINFCSNAPTLSDSLFFLPFPSLLTFQPYYLQNFNAFTCINILKL